MEELKRTINDIFSEEIIKLVISNKVNKDVKYNKINKKYDINIMKYLYHIFYLNSSKNVRQNSTFIYPNS